VEITVRHLLHMSSGLADFDYPEFDNALLKAGATRGRARSNNQTVPKPVSKGGGCVVCVRVAGSLFGICCI
jgi:CubicO group peptidase (beta-lactamase class C family)